MEGLRPGDPRQVGPYRLESRLGGGGMGQVYLGRFRSGRPVAVKIVRPEFAGDAGFRRRFALEVEAARRVGGFFAAQVVDADPDADPPWLVTAYIPGPSLHAAVERHGPLPATALGVLGAGLAEGLAAVHACDLVHRDLKPSNVLLADDGPRVIDFGIARALDATAHTLTQGVVGTPSFMSPEQANGEAAGPPSDVFALGSVLVFAATGRGPFGAGPALAILRRVIDEEPDLTGLTGALRETVAACLAKDPDDRPTVAEVLDRLAAPAATATRWLPPEITTVIPEPDGSPPGGTGTGPHVPPPRREPRTGPAELTIGNLGPDDLDVIVDGTTLGTVRPGEHGTFTVDSGTRTVQAAAGRNHSAARRMRLDPDTTTRLAYDIPNGGQLPEPVTEATFTTNKLREAFDMGWKIATIAGGFSLLLWLAEMYLEDEALPKTLTPGAVLALSLLVGLVVGLLMIGHNHRLVLRSTGFTFEAGHWRRTTTEVAWEDVQQVSLIKHRLTAWKMVVWFKSGRTPPPGEEFQGGIVVGVGEIITQGKPAAGIRRALRWFAGDLYVDQPNPAPENS
ncbi:serine/threonine-protein kinase [Actinomadura sediminis]|uniref:Serine/threonine-protein kinase n=1 Tax=Actinomadura sediminis TaxID=1038904 RepID=A0ABW3EF96_9ACTN